MDGRDDDGIASGCPGALPQRHRKSTKGFSHAASNPNPTCRVGGRKMKDSTAVGSKVPAVGLHCYRNNVPAVATFKVQLDRYV